eukprot:363901-Chlamydomonas_euryale.AAC.5
MRMELDRGDSAPLFAPATAMDGMAAPAQPLHSLGGQGGQGRGRTKERPIGSMHVRLGRRASRPAHFKANAARQSSAIRSDSRPGGPEVGCMRGCRSVRTACQQCALTYAGASGPPNALGKAAKSRGTTAYRPALAPGISSHCSPSPRRSCAVAPTTRARAQKIRGADLVHTGQSPPRRLCTPARKSSTAGSVHAGASCSGPTGLSSAWQWPRRAQTQI